MSIIPCTSECIYQLEGLCRLEHAASGCDGLEDCAHFVGRARNHSNPQPSAVSVNQTHEKTLL